MRKSPPCRKSLKYSHTLTRKHTDGPQKSSHNTALVVFLVCLGVNAVCVLCVRTQSHISSGISWGLRMPGTDICSLCFSSWAWRSDASLSSRNRSEVSSPANSYSYTEKQVSIRAFCLHWPLCQNAVISAIIALSPSHTHLLSPCTQDDPYSYTMFHYPLKVKGTTLSRSHTISISSTTHSQLHKHYYYWYQNISIKANITCINHYYTINYYYGSQCPCSSPWSVQGNPSSVPWMLGCLGLNWTDQSQILWPGHYKEKEQTCSQTGNTNKTRHKQS